MRRSLRHAGLVLGGAMLLGGASAVAAGPAALAAPHAAGSALAGRADLASASAADTSGQLHAVAAVSSRDVWAVGCSGSCKGPDSLILHWNGTTWSRVASANPGSSFNDLQAVSAASASDIQAAGNQLGANLPYDTLTEHWNGKTWSAVASPNGTTSDTGVNMLSGISAISGSDAVAVGWAQGSGVTYQVLILQWNGKTWSKA